MKDIRQASSEFDQTRYLIGTSGWTYDDWKGTFYPPALPNKTWFEYYAGIFSTL